MAKDGFAEIAHAAGLKVQGPRLEDTPRVITAKAGTQRQESTGAWPKPYTREVRDG